VKHTPESILKIIRLVTSGSPNGTTIKFRIVHRFRRAGTICLPGEEITAVYFVDRGREMVVPLPLALRVLFDYLAHHRHTPQSAVQIAAGIRASAFYRKHGMNAGIPSRRKVSRSGVKEYVKRIRHALELALSQKAPHLDVSRLIVSVKTVGNEVQYQLCASVEWVHTEELPY
jgi:hypothetical protein